MDECYYLYALTWASCPAERLGPGVDPRFPVELLPCTRLAALASRVGLDQFDIAKLQSESTDVPWLTQVALRHNQIVTEAAQHAPLLPLRLGILFQSATSLRDKIARCEMAAADFLGHLGDGQEWAAKMYADARLAEQASDPTRHPPAFPPAAAGAGQQYLAQRQVHHQQNQDRQQQLHRTVLGVKELLTANADRYCRVRPLPANLTGRSEKMIWNAAFLVSRAKQDRWLARVDEVRQGLRSEGLSLEVSGPWPPYHFCPTLDL